LYRQLQHPQVLLVVRRQLFRLLKRSLRRGPAR
jgi:hypothetical protein